MLHGCLNLQSSFIYRSLTYRAAKQLLGSGCGRQVWRLKMRLGDEASPASLLLSISPPLLHEGHPNLLWIQPDINIRRAKF